MGALMYTLEQIPAVFLILIIIHRCSAISAVEQKIKHARLRKQIPGNPLKVIGPGLPHPHEEQCKVNKRWHSDQNRKGCSQCIWADVLAFACLVSSILLWLKYLFSGGR